MFSSVQATQGEPGSLTKNRLYRNIFSDIGAYYFKLLAYKIFPFLFCLPLSSPFFLLYRQGLAVQPGLELFFLRLQSAGNIGMLYHAYGVAFLWTKH